MTHLYLQENSDVANAEINPLLHYVLFGQYENRGKFESSFLINANKNQFEVDGRAIIDGENNEKDIDVLRNYFDAGFYRNTYSDVDGLDDDLILHYLKTGWKEGRDPSPSFSTSYYLSAYEDISENNLNPFLHYILFGKDEGRTAQPIDIEESEKNKLIRFEGSVEQRLELDMDAVASEFDAVWYSTNYPDVVGDDRDLLHHYMTEGWLKGYDPSPRFSTDFYVNAYPDIQKSGANPLLHYVLFGQFEGRKASKNSIVKLKKDKQAKLPLSITGIRTDCKHIKYVKAPNSFDRNCLDIHWVIPDFRPGAGGHMTIFRMVKFLEILGHKNTIWIEESTFHTMEHDAWETIIKHFQCVEAEVHFVDSKIYKTKGDVVIATAWSTAWLVQKLRGFSAKMYFVQDHEPEFYATGSRSNLARLTYNFELGCICASPWLKGLMEERYGRWAEAFYLAYDPEIYFVATDKIRSNELLRIAVYARSHTERRCVGLAIAALQHLSETRDDFEVHFFGQEKLEFNEVPFDAVNHGVLNPEELASLYNSCDLALSFSGTNYSLVPQEIMACGLPLIELDTESTRKVFPPSVVTFAGPDPLNISKKINSLLNSSTKRDRQSRAALRWVKQFSWEDSAKVVERSILSYLQETTSKISAPTVYIPARQPVLDLVVPVWNGMKEFAPVLEMIRQQRLYDQIQVHCVDSSSTDGTTEWLASQPDVSLTVIDQSEFQHGRTRNFGASLGSAPFISFITQDAMPVSCDWATDIVKMLRAVPDAAGLFGRHKAYPSHPEFVQAEIRNHFNSFLNFPLAVSKETDRQRWESGDLEWRRFLHFYSDNNSTMRRSVWKEIPYPEISYGEDQVWARDIIEAGYTKLYAPTACVYHSHDYGPTETFERARIEAAFFFTHFGYKLADDSEDEIKLRVLEEQALFRAWAYSHPVSAEEEESRLNIIEAKHRGWRAGLDQVLGAI